MEAFIAALLTEQGIVVGLLVTIVLALVSVVKILWGELEEASKTNKEMSDKVFKTVENNTEVITQLVERLK